MRQINAPHLWRRQAHQRKQLTRLLLVAVAAFANLACQHPEFTEFALTAAVLLGDRQMNERLPDDPYGPPASRQWPWMVP